MILSKEKVLYVDDNEANRLTLPALLEFEGFDVDVASSFEQGRRMIFSGEYGFVLLDQELGDGLGSELAPVVRRRLPGAKVVLLSGQSQEDQLAACADALLTKGSPFIVLLATLERLSASR